MRILVLTTDPLTDRMPGPSIRAWHLAAVLSEHHDVTLASTVAATRARDGLRVLQVDRAQIQRLENWMDAAIVPPGAVPDLAGSQKPVAVDIYDPYHLENLEPDGHMSGYARSTNVAAMTRSLNVALRRGDFFICASERQRDFWLGSLAALGRVNPYTYDQSKDLRRLVDVVPFGVPDTPPVRSGPGLRGVIPGIAAADPIVVWGGGVYDWFDPCSVIRAVDALRRRMPNVRLVFTGMGHPNPAMPEMRVASAARQLADSLGVTGKHVFFMDGWVPYDERANVLLDATAAVSTHLDTIETRYSFRTRVLDYIWAGLPMVLTEGDVLAEEVSSSGAGVAVPPGNVAAIEQGLYQVLTNPRPVGDLAQRFRWKAIAGPITDFCGRPSRAPDVVSRAQRARTQLAIRRPRRRPAGPSGRKPLSSSEPS